MILDTLLSIVAPFECLNCQKEGMIVCVDCRQYLLALPPRCYRCKKFSKDFRVCLKCRGATTVYCVGVATVYEGFAKDMVWRMKYGSAQAASTEMTEIILDRLPNPDKDIIVSPIPTTTRRTRQRGYDQAKLLAKELARQSDVSYGDFIARVGVAHQVGARRSVRKSQLKEVFRIKRPDRIRGRHILLVDDVLTTGATIESAAKALKKAGAFRVSAVVFAQTE
jgi:ComF family protein